jgi:hypothetical protein
MANCDWPKIFWFLFKEPVSSVARCDENTNPTVPLGTTLSSDLASVFGTCATCLVIVVLYHFAVVMSLSY